MSINKCQDCNFFSIFKFCPDKKMNLCNSCHSKVDHPDDSKCPENNRCRECKCHIIEKYCHVKKMKLCTFCHRKVVHKENSECIKLQNRDNVLILKKENKKCQKCDFFDYGIYCNLKKINMCKFCHNCVKHKKGEEEHFECVTDINKVKIEPKKIMCETCNDTGPNPYFEKCLQDKKWQCKACHKECLNLVCRAIDGLNMACKDCGYKIDYNSGNSEKRIIYYHKNNVEFKKYVEYEKGRFLYCEHCHEKHCKDNEQEKCMERLVCN